MTPSVFVSYSHDDLDHKRWVLALATRLRKSGIDVTLDQWDLDAGDDLGSFMTNNLANADRVLMICTPNYVEKANEGKGGVGVERMILTAEYLSNIDSNKVIPVIKKHGAEPVPAFFSTKLYIDFSQPGEYEAAFDDLLRNILGKPLVEKPEIGNSPFEESVDAMPQPSHDPVKDLMKIVITAYEQRGDSSFEIRRLQTSGFASSRTMADVIISKAVERGYVSMDHMNGCVWLEDKGKHYAIENELV
ncbi:MULTISPECIES: toll/interleukin-1 receptor domain-containing protein [Cycloclasticus]|jgi:hypothetical protein|uniref:SEFIR domain-containing protein n=1 Tax=Cycloclasticus pugetii TaxID=34068 RepID=A0AB33Z1T6_9GAMM|nr:MULTISPECIES: toll/interleukin-1 receptor domain-containing protein [Cycloclasticus]ATI03141.1 toll/interleukin-1 receptor domain-containing protein [Cycloclasticus sp. PY97N]EPD13416.1 SEFIR domain-containing protein [Cycloclasticus pugetii]